MNKDNFETASRLILEAKAHLDGAIDLLPRDKPRRRLIEITHELTLQAAELPSQAEEDFKQAVENGELMTPEEYADFYNTRK